MQSRMVTSQYILSTWPHYCSKEHEEKVASLKEQLSTANASATAASRVSELESQLSELMDTVEIMTLDAEQKALEYEAMEEKLKELEKAASVSVAAPPTVIGAKVIYPFSVIYLIR